MFSLVQKRRWYFLISAILIIPGIVAMIYSTLTIGSLMRLGIDFTGGSIWELSFGQRPTPGRVRAVLEEAGFSEASVQSVGGDKNLAIRTRQIEVATKQALQAALAREFGG